jgi:hypothetical protein
MQMQMTFFLRANANQEFFFLTFSDFYFLMLFKRCQSGIGVITFSATTTKIEVKSDCNLQRSLELIFQQKLDESFFSKMIFKFN